MYVSDTLSTGNNIEEMHAYYFVVIFFINLSYFIKTIDCYNLSNIEFDLL